MAAAPEGEADAGLDGEAVAADTANAGPEGEAVASDSKDAAAHTGSALAASHVPEELPAKSADAVLADGHQQPGDSNAEPPPQALQAGASVDDEANAGDEPPSKRPRRGNQILFKEGGATAKLSAAAAAK